VVDALGKRLSTATIMFHTAVADRMKVGVTDAKCRSILLQHGRMTAGELARRLGLTTGAVTGVIDRLEGARLVRRATDSADRRRVVVELVPNPKAEREIALLFAPMAKRIKRLLAGYDENERSLIAEFITKASEILEEETIRLRTRRQRRPSTRHIAERRGPRRITA
jgi:DNA-binding MarR family transcriptional regulator